MTSLAINGGNISPRTFREPQLELVANNAWCDASTHDKKIAQSLIHPEAIWETEFLGCRDGEASQRSNLHSLHYNLAFDRSNLMLEHIAAVKRAKRSMPHIFSLPGLSEHIESPMRRRLQDGLADRLMHSPFTSIGSNGMDGGFSNDRSSYDTAIEQRLTLFRTLQQRPDVLGIGTSKGAVQMNGIANRNLDEGEPVKFRGLVYFSPAIVEPQKVFGHMVLRFPLRTGFDAVRQTMRLTKEERHEVLSGAGEQAAQFGMDMPTIANEIVHLLPGMRRELTERVVAHHRVLVITGATDAVGEKKMWRSIQEKYPDNLKLVVIPKRGHDLMMFRDAPDMLVKHIHESGILETH